MSRYVTQEARLKQRQAKPWLVLRDTSYPQLNMTEADKALFEASVRFVNWPRDKHYGVTFTFTLRSDQLPQSNPDRDRFAGNDHTGDTAVAMAISRDPLMRITENVRNQLAALFGGQTEAPRMEVRFHDPAPFRRGLATSLQQVDPSELRAEVELRFGRPSDIPYRYRGQSQVESLVGPDSQFLTRPDYEAAMPVLRLWLAALLPAVLDHCGSAADVEQKRQAEYLAKMVLLDELRAASKRAYEQIQASIRYVEKKQALEDELNEAMNGRAAEFRNQLNTMALTEPVVQGLWGTIRELVLQRLEKHQGFYVYDAKELDSLIAEARRAHAAP